MISWTYASQEGSTKPCRRCWHSSVMVNSNTLIIFGGYITESNSTFVDDMFQYHIDTCEWEEIETVGDIPSPRHSHSIVQIKDKLLLFGGEGFTCLDDLYEFDLDTKEWRQLLVEDAAPAARCGHSATVWRNNMVIFGGECYPNKCNDLHLFDLDNNKWQEIPAANRPPARNGHISECIRNELWVFGGWGYGQCFNDVYKLNLATGSSWQQVKITSPICPSPRGRHASVTLPNNNILVFGGQHNTENNELWLLDTKHRSWNQITVDSQPGDNNNNNNVSPEPRSGHTMCLSGTNMYIFGGITGHFSSSSNIIIFKILDLLSSYNYDISDMFGATIPSVNSNRKPLIK